MYITDRNYIRVLQSTEVELAQVARFLAQTKNQAAIPILKAQSAIRNVITSEANKKRKEKLGKTVIQYEQTEKEKKEKLKKLLERGRE